MKVSNPRNTEFLDPNFCSGLEQFRKNVLHIVSTIKQWEKNGNKVLTEKETFEQYYNKESLKNFKEEHFNVDRLFNLISNTSKEIQEIDKKSKGSYLLSARKILENKLDLLEKIYHEIPKEKPKNEHLNNNNRRANPIHDQRDAFNQNNQFFANLISEEDVSLLSSGEDDDDESDDDDYISINQAPGGERRNSNSNLKFDESPSKCKIRIKVLDYMESIVKLINDQISEDNVKMTEEIEKTLNNMFLTCSQILKDETVKALKDDPAISCVLNLFYSELRYKIDTKEFEFVIEDFSKVLEVCNGIIELDTLEKSIKAGNKEKVREFFRKYPDFKNFFMLNGRTPLFYAIEKKNKLRFIKILVNELNMNVNAKGEMKYDSCPLHVAASTSQQKIYDFLESKMARQEVNALGKPPMSYANFLNLSDGKWWYWDSFNGKFCNFTRDIGSLLNRMLESANERDKFEEIIRINNIHYYVDFEKFVISPTDGIGDFEYPLQCRGIPDKLISIKWQYTESLNNIKSVRDWKFYDESTSLCITNAFLSGQYFGTQTNPGKEIKIKLFFEQNSEDHLDFVNFNRYKLVDGVKKKAGVIRWKKHVEVMQFEEEEPILPDFRKKRSLNEDEDQPFLEEEESDYSERDEQENNKKFIDTQLRNLRETLKNKYKEKKERIIKNPELIIEKTYDLVENKIGFIDTFARKEIACRCELMRNVLEKFGKEVKIDFLGKKIKISGTEDDIFSFECTIYPRIQFWLKVFGLVENNLIKSIDKLYQKHVSELGNFLDYKIVKISKNEVIWNELKTRYIKVWKEGLDSESNVCREIYIHGMSELVSDVIKGEGAWISKLVKWIEGASDSYYNRVHSIKFDLFYETFECVLNEKVDVSTMNIKERDGERFKEDKMRKIMNFYVTDILKEYKESYGDKKCSFMRNLCNELPNLLFRFGIIRKAYEKNLPIFLQSRKILKNIDECDINFVETSTGSGKSTLLPLLLYASNKYKKIVCTQPRRFPCFGITKYLNKTYGSHLVGWKVSGNSHNTHNPLLYVTDGFLREVFLHNPEHVIKEWETDVLIIDEVHERSLNIDLLIALIKELKYSPTRKSPLFKNLKIIFSSATLDINSIKRPFMSIRNRVFSIKENSPFKISTPSNHDWRQNPLDCVKMINQNRKSGEQILCFLPSVGKVNHACNYFKEKYQITALPLYAQQDPKLQEKYLQDGTIFFSTNIAETSLTFPKLKYVVDSGKVNVARFKNSTSELVEEDAPKSTKEQRKGRVGRTSPGFYYNLYDINKQNTQKYHDPQIKKLNLLDIDFSLRRSNKYAKKGIEGIDKNSWPTEPPKDSLKNIKDELNSIGVINKNRLVTIDNNFFPRMTNIGKEIVEYPTLGGVRNSVVMYYSIRENIGDTILRLMSILMSLPNNQRAFLENIPQRYKNCTGDMMTLLNVFDDALSVFSTPKVKIGSIRGLKAIANVLRKAIDKYKNIKEEFSKIKKFSNKIRGSTNNWEDILKCLLKSYYNNTFFSTQKLADYHNEFIQLNVNNKYQRAILNKSSSLKALPPQKNSKNGALIMPTCFLALSTFKTQIKVDSGEKDETISMVSLLGEIKEKNFEYMLEETLNERNEMERVKGWIVVK